MGVNPTLGKSAGELPSPVKDLATEVKKSLSGSGFTSGDNAVTDSLQPIARIATKAQSFLEKSIMGRGLTVQRFSAGNPGKNWSKNFPYRFLVTRVNKAGRHSVVAEYRLPINPQELVTTTPYAIKTTVTSRGIMEEHNGIPLKQINIVGTTGVMIERESGGKEQKRNDFVGTIFGGTLDAVDSATRQVSVAANSLGLGGQGPFQNNSEEPEYTRTGYYQHQMLRLFLDTYAETKKAPNNQDLRLIFENTKDRVSYIVTPLNRVERRSVASPMEYLYTIQLLAWGTVPDFVGTTEEVSASFLSSDPGDLRKALNALKNLRKVTRSFQNVISAARADVESNIFGPINDTILLTKDILSIPIAIADLPQSLRQSLQTSVIANWDSLVQTNTELKELFDGKMQSIKNELSGSDTFVVSGDANGQSAASSYKPEVLDNIDLTDNVEISNLQLTENQQIAVNDAVESAKLTTINEVNALVAELQNLSTALETTIAEKSAVDEEWDILYSLNDTIGEMYALIANGQLNNSIQQDQDAEDNAYLSTNAMAFWNQTAEDNGIGFEEPLGKFSIPFPLGSSLEQLAAAYLGNSTRWMEIAALNGLQAPYIDEVGFIYKLLGNGFENQINVESDLNLYLGQTVYLSSTTERVSKRKIQAISKISDTNFLLTLDGLPNLANFTTAAEAEMKAYLPYTVNAMKSIYIPVDVPSTDPEFDTPPITFLTDDIDLIKFSKIDWLLDSNMDLAVTSDGFMNLAFGTTNLKQAAVLKLRTPAGSKLLYPEYGAGVEPGTSFADINLEDLARRIAESFASDYRYNSPSYINLDAAPTVLAMSVGVAISRGNNIMPLTLPLFDQK